MPNNIALLTGVRFLHDLATAVWIGGLITLGLVVLPASRKVLGGGPETKKLLGAIQRRLSVFIYVSIAGLVLKGFMIIIEIISMFARPFSLAVRLFANMTAGHLVIMVFISMPVFIFKFPAIIKYITQVDINFCFIEKKVVVQAEDMALKFLIRQFRCFALGLFFNAFRDTNLGIDIIVPQF